MIMMGKDQGSSYEEIKDYDRKRARIKDEDCEWMRAINHDVKRRKYFVYYGKRLRIIVEGTKGISAS